MAAKKAGTKRSVSLWLPPRDLAILRIATRRYGGLARFLSLLAVALREAGAQDARLPATPPAPSPPIVRPRRPSPRLAEALAELERRFGLNPPSVPSAAEADVELGDDGHGSA